MELQHAQKCTQAQTEWGAWGGRAGALPLRYDWLSWLSLAEKAANEGRGRFALGTRGLRDLRRSAYCRCASLKAGEGTWRHSLRVTPASFPLVEGTPTSGSFPESFLASLPPFSQE